MPLVGGAIGATIALKFAVKYPQCVNGLVLLSPTFNPPQTGGMSAAPAVMPASAAQPAGAARKVDTTTLIEAQGVRVYLKQQLENFYPASLRTHPQRLARFMVFNWLAIPPAVH